MRIRVISLVIALTPAALLAQNGTVQSQSQASGQAQATGSQMSGKADASTEAQASGQFRIPSEYSIDTRAQLEATMTTARIKHLPQSAIENRIAEGHAKSAAEADVVASARQLEANMEATHDAMVAAGHSSPSDAEITRGATVMERGATRAQVDALLKTAPRDRSMVVSFGVLGNLMAQGSSTDDAFAQVTAKLKARASDASITKLAPSATAQGSASGNAGTTSGGASAGAAVSGNAAAGAAGAAGAAAGSVTTTVGGSLGLPK